MKIKQAVKVLKNGGIIAYPTEGVFGLGCDPFNETAVLRLLKIKKRKIEKGLILIASNWNQVRSLIKTSLIKTSLPKNKNPIAITWVFPSTKKAPIWITGKFNSVAIRVTSHQVAKKLCRAFGGPIVSTSANLNNKKPVKNLKQLYKQFAYKTDYILPGQVGDLGKPTEIWDARTNKLLRK